MGGRCPNNVIVDIDEEGVKVFFFIRLDAAEETKLLEELKKLGVEGKAEVEWCG